MIRIYRTEIRCGKWKLACYPDCFWCWLDNELDYNAEEMKAKGNVGPKYIFCYN